MAVFKLTIAYDGTNYGGWQVQPNSVGIQTLIQKALETILREKIDLTGSGRTDSGVHALGQSAHFKTEKSLDLDKVLYSINSLLPRDIRVLKIERADDRFHARYSAIAKVYRYRIDTVYDPFNRFYSWHVGYKLDRDLLQKALGKYLGTHDFKGFANESHSGSAAHDSIRTMTRSELIQNGNEISIWFEADGFLYKMVRNLVGTAIDIARGHLPIDTIDIVFETGDRKKAGQTAPPHGLTLFRVVY
ncbi:MAG: tRNA pseudouridine(38-40) synthase TruA [Parachlamydiaceae bacterium]